MAEQSSDKFDWSWTEASVLGSQVFGRALMESCELHSVKPLGMKSSSSLDIVHIALTPAPLYLWTPLRNFFPPA